MTDTVVDINATNNQNDNNNHNTNNNTEHYSGDGDGDDQDSVPEPSATPTTAALIPDVQDVMAPNNRRRDPTGDQAVMGANHDDGNVEGLEAIDENGELVRGEFLKFLQGL